jgi:thiamine biosynthesis lipoprotein
MDELTFRAMGSDAHVIVLGGGRHLVEMARQRIDELEQRWSRFVPGSEVNQLTEHAGDWVPVSDDTHLLVERAIEGWRLSAGRVDPTVLGAVLRAGYDRSFDQLERDAAPVQSALLIGCTDIELRPGAVRLPAGTGFDPGGIGKGLAADLVAREVLADGAEGVCINLGGDLRLLGASPDGAGWTVAIEHPWRPDPLANVGLLDGAVATSTTLKRRWQTDGAPRHHLIDPSTGEPSTTDINLVTVIAGDAWRAEVLAKAVLLRGSEHPFDIVGGSGAVALAVTDDGSILLSDGFAAFLGDQVLPAALSPLPTSPR